MENNNKSKKEEMSFAIAIAAIFLVVTWFALDLISRELKINGFLVFCADVLLLAAAFAIIMNQYGED